MTSDPNDDVATKQIALIQDEQYRNRMYECALGAWLERDQPAAQKWINTANLPASLMESLGKR